MENWDDLRFVVALARYGSMAVAARHLRTNTATVSRRIKRINETSGQTLFVKGASGWDITPDGRKLYELASGFGEELLSLASANPQLDEQKRLIKVSATEFLVSDVLAPALSNIQDSYPNLSLELSATDSKASLAYGEADIALRLVRPTEGRLIAKRLTQLNLGVFGKPAHPSKEWIGLVYELDWTPEMRYATEYFGCEPKYRVASFSSIIAAMETTHLPGVCPSFMIKKFSQFKALQPEREMCRREIWLLIHETKKNDVAVRDACNWIEKTFASL